MINKKNEFQCEFCSKSYAKLSYFENHKQVCMIKKKPKEQQQDKNEQQEDKNEQNQFQCQFCPKSYTRFFYFEKHKQVCKTYI